MYGLSSKKYIFVLAYLFIALLSSMMARADLVITTPIKAEYNLGDALSIEGYILAKKDTTETVSVKLICDAYTLENTAQLTLKEGDKVLLSSLGVSQFTLNANQKAMCKIVVTYNQESAETSSFAVVDALIGAFTVENKKSDYRLGDQFILRGSVFKKDGMDISGIAKVYSTKDNGNAVALGEAKIVNGKITFTYVFSNLQFGLYSFDVEVTDTTGNKNYLKNVASFKLSNDLLIKASLEKSTVNPGDEIVINGEILTNPINPTETTLKFKVADQTYTLVPPSSKFQYKFSLPNDIDSGSYALLVTISDKYGNSGYTNTPLSVRRVAKSLDITVNKKTFNPGEVLDMNVDVLDQRGKAMEETLALEIKDPNNNDIFNDNVRSSQPIKIEFGQFSVPGYYTIKAQKNENNLRTEESVSVAANKQLSVDYTPNTLYIKNQGNIPYTSPVDIVLVDKKTPEEKYYVVRKDIGLKPQEEKGIPLSKEVPPGQYDIYVDDKITPGKDNEVTGNAIAQDLRTFSPEDLVNKIKETQHIFSDVNVDADERGLGKRLGQGVSRITGATTYSNESPFSGAVLTTLFIIIVIGVLGVFAYRNREFYLDNKETSQNKFIKKQDDHIFGGRMQHNDPFRIQGKTSLEERQALIKAAQEKKEKQSKGFFKRKEEQRDFSLSQQASKDGDLDPEIVNDMVQRSSIRKESPTKIISVGNSAGNIQGRSLQPTKVEPTPKPLLGLFDKAFPDAQKNPVKEQEKTSEKKSDDSFALEEDI